MREARAGHRRSYPTFRGKADLTPHDPILEYSAKVPEQVRVPGIKRGRAT
jgi:hypothetical protein